MPNRIVLAAMAVLSEEPESFEDVLKFLENFNENYFGDSKIKTIQDIKIIDDLVSNKIMKYATNLDEPIIKEIIKENEIFFAIYNDIDFDESIMLSLNGNSFNIPTKQYDEISDKLQELLSIELQERAERLYQVAIEINESHVVTHVLAYSFIERKLLELIDENLSNLVSISQDDFPDIPKYK